MSADVYSRITGQIVAELEKGVLPWVNSPLTKSAGSDSMG